MDSTLEQTLDQIKSLCESITQTPLGTVIKLKKEAYPVNLADFYATPKPHKVTEFEELFLKLYPYGYGWYPESGSFIIPQPQILIRYPERGSFIIPQPQILMHSKEKKSDAETEFSPQSQPQNVKSQTETVAGLEERGTNTENVKAHLEKLAAAFAPRMSETEIQESITFLFKQGLSPKKIESETGASRATIYRNIPKEIKRHYEKTR
jgi:uncharacterized protein YerC